MEDQTLKKQNFLRIAILEKGFDPAHFTEYLDAQRPDGTDIDNWSFSSLEESVNQYIMTNIEKPQVAGETGSTIKVLQEENLSDDDTNPEEKPVEAEQTKPGSEVKDEKIPEERKRIATEIMIQSDQEKLAMNVPPASN